MSDSMNRREFVTRGAAAGAAIAFTRELSGQPAGAQESTAATIAAAAPESSNSAPSSTIYQLDELAWPQIAAFDRERTMFLLPVGMLEQHGPHLPIGSDTLGVTYEAIRAAERVSRALTGWSIVMMPPINYGNAGANLVGDMLVHPGTYSIRQSTLRALAADLGEQLAQNGFKWIFVLNGHGAPTQAIALNEACDFVSQTFGVTMLHLSGLFKGDAAIQAAGQRMHERHFSTAEVSSFGMDVHAGVAETSAILAVRRDLVASNYKALPSRVANSQEELRQIATTPGWQGYFSAPARASAAHGRAVEAWWIDGFADLILRAVRGENMFAHARVPETIPPAAAPPLEKALANEAAFEARLQSWLEQRRKR